MQKYWSKNPPLHQGVKYILYWLGILDPKKEEEEHSSTENEYSDSLEDLMADFAAAGGVIG